MTAKRSDTVDYTNECTVLINYVEGDIARRIAYERPQPQIPDGPLSSFDRIRIAQFATDDDLTVEARKIFADMRRKGDVKASADLASVFIARTASAALEMDL